MRGEGEGGPCTVGPTVDLVAAGLAAACVALALALRDRRRAPVLLGAATLMLVVPVVRSLLFA